MLKLLDSFYVDNCVASVNSMTHLCDFIADSKTVIAAGGFDLRGWEYSADQTGSDQASVLGILWNKREDTFSLNAPILENVCFEKITKRTILSMAYRIYDPLGVACPLLLCPKIILQETWADKLSWDQEVNEVIRDRFMKWVNQLEHLEKISIPRCIIGVLDSDAKVSVHTFCDASKVAYAAVIFIRLEDSLGVRLNFVQAKSRVSPINKITVPRLELLAACIAARLTVSTLEVLKLENCDTYFWSDSSTVLAWIQRNCQWSTFIWNSVLEIRKLTKADQWWHVPGELNPADLPSRGCSLNQLLESKWWEGPEWLKRSPENWPGQEISPDESVVNSEMRKTPEKEGDMQVNDHIDSQLLGVSSGVEVAVSSPWYARRFSDYSRILCTIGWIKRFIFNIRCKKTAPTRGELSVLEIEAAELTLIQIIQKESNLDEASENLKNLTVFRDPEGILRLKTRIIMRTDSFNFLCPIVLPGKHSIVQALIREKHLQLAHAGVQILLNDLREKYWVLGGRKVIRSVIRKCVICRRHDSKPFEVAPAPLPKDRIRDAAVFEVVGIDFAGPVFLKNSQKAWVCLFICAVYRAVHLELVTSLSTTAFLEALRRFIARRGRPSVIYTDNGTNFIGLDNLLKGIDWQMVSRIGALQRIQWNFNPPTAAWWGGWWERLIGVMKKLLKRVLKKSCLSYEEMITVLCDCEAVMNLRPITFMSDEKQEFVPLTPSMFLQQLQEIGVIDLDQIEECALGKRFLYRQKKKGI